MRKFCIQLSDRYHPVVIMVMAVWIAFLWETATELIQLFTGKNTGKVIHIFIILFLGTVCWFFFCTLMMLVRKYQASPSGLMIYYPFGIKKLYSWEAFGSVCVTKVDFRTRLDDPDFEVWIRFAVGKEHNGPGVCDHSWARWKNPSYYITRAYKIIQIQYTKDRFQEIQQVCPFEIPDYFH